MELTPPTSPRGQAGGPELAVVLGADPATGATLRDREHVAALAELKARMAFATSCSRLSDFVAVPVDPAHAWEQFQAWPEARCYQLGDDTVLIHLHRCHWYRLSEAAPQQPPADAPRPPYVNTESHRANLAALGREAEHGERPALAARLREAERALAEDRHTWARDALRSAGAQMAGPDWDAAAAYVHGLIAELADVIARYAPDPRAADRRAGGCAHRQPDRLTRCH